MCILYVGVLFIIWIISPTQKLNDFITMLSIGDANPKHNGNYTCQASNAAATTNYTATLRVDGSWHLFYLPIMTWILQGSLEVHVLDLYKMIKISHDLNCEGYIVHVYNFYLTCCEFAIPKPLQGDVKHT